MKKNVQIEQDSLISYGRMAMKEYGSYTLEDRAVPDFRDGLKPVQRRILWAANQMGVSFSKNVFKKSAGIVGAVIGRFHPHGDKSAYDALVAMTHTMQRTIEGSGNFGTLIDNAAAMRYTECRLSEYSDSVFFQSQYKNVIDTCQNFDGSEREPIVLPSNIPNLLLNGAYGIATGSTCSIPAFEPEGVMQLTWRAINGKPITPKMCMKQLVPRCPEGGYYCNDEDLQSDLYDFYSTGRGSVYWIPDAEINTDKKYLKISGFVPKVAKSLLSGLDKVANNPNVSSIDDVSYLDENGNTRLAYQINLKRSIRGDLVEDELYYILSLFEGRQSLVMSVTERNKNEELDQHEATFSYISMPQFFEQWAKWRIELERRSIDYELEVNRINLHKDKLMLLAVNNLQVIIQALQDEDPISYLSKELDISIEDSTFIFNKKVIQLKKLEASLLKERIKNIRSDIKQLKEDHISPQTRIRNAMKLAVVK